jgi:hypothetical protein
MKYPQISPHGMSPGAKTAEEEGAALRCVCACVCVC